jgi:elongation factor 1-gamma
MPKFWEMLDRTGYTLWHQRYKYNAENKRDFMTSNLVAGFIQRSEELRRYAFGVMHVLNTEAPYEVEGVWLMRGTDVKAMLDCNPDGEYYDWERIDPESEAGRQLVADTWCTYEKLGGKPVYGEQGKGQSLSEGFHSAVTFVCGTLCEPCRLQDFQVEWARAVQFAEFHPV